MAISFLSCESANGETSESCISNVGASSQGVKDGATRSKVFDRQHALSRLGGMEEVLFDVMELMTTESVKVHADINSAFIRRDSVALQRSAHTLKGAASIVGAIDLTTRLKRVEGCASANDFERAAEEIPEIDRQFAELQSRLALELQSRP